MNTFQLECFLTVAETLNFIKAAQIMSITQPAVTKNIKTLEDELGVRLFKRSTRNVELTHEGKLLINDARVIIETSHRAKDRFCGETEEYKSFTIGIRLPTHIKYLYEPLKELILKYEKFRPMFRVDTISDLYRALYDEQVDIILDVRNKHSGYDSIFFKEIFTERIFCVCTENFPVYNMESVTIEQIRSLDKYPLILMYAPKALKEISDAEQEYIGNRTQSMVCFCSTVEEVLLLAELGCGMAVIPEMIVPDNHRLRKIPVVDGEPIPFGVYYKGSSPSEIVRSFIDIMKKNACKMRRPIIE